MSSLKYRVFYATYNLLDEAFLFKINREMFSLQSWIEFESRHPALWKWGHSWTNTDFCCGNLKCPEILSAPRVEQE